MAEKNFFEELNKLRTGSGDDSEIHLENANIDCRPQNEYVSKRTVKKIDDVLEGGEKVHFLAKGLKGVKIRSSRIRGERKLPSKYSRTAATDRRVVCKLSNFLKDDDVSIPYHSITDVDLKSGFSQTTYLILHTSTKTYKVDIDGIQNDEAKSMVQFIQTKVREVQYSSPQPQSQSSEDPLDRLERLQDLKEEGAISEEEFEEKKSQLLDQI